MNELSEQDLAPHAQRALDRAYDRRERRQMSHEDFTAGFITALVWLNSRSSFSEAAAGRLEAARQHL